MEDFAVGVLPNDNPITAIMQSGYNLGYDTGYQAGVEAAQPKWISVEERLPGESETVLAYRDGCCGVASLLDVEPEIMWTFTGFGGDPTHWMPLPEPPKEK